MSSVWSVVCNDCGMVESFRTPMMAPGGRDENDAAEGRRKQPCPLCDSRIRTYFHGSDGPMMRWEVSCPECHFCVYPATIKPPPDEAGREELMKRSAQRPWPACAHDGKTWQLIEVRR